VHQVIPVKTFFLISTAARCTHFMYFYKKLAQYTMLATACLFRTVLMVCQGEGLAKVAEFYHGGLGLSVVQAVDDWFELASSLLTITPKAHVAIERLAPDTNRRRSVALRSWNHANFIVLLLLLLPSDC
jgi:hypothetical protein